MQDGDEGAQLYFSVPNGRAAISSRETKRDETVGYVFVSRDEI